MDKKIQDLIDKALIELSKEEFDAFMIELRQKYPDYFSKKEEEEQTEEQVVSEVGTQNPL